MGGIVLQAVVVGFIHAYGVIGLVVDLRVAPLLSNPVMGISGLQAQGTFVVPFIHAVGVQCMGFVEEQPLLVEGSADARLYQKAVQGNLLGCVVCQYMLLTAKVGTVVVALVAVDALLAFTQLEGIGGVFPKKRSFVPLRLCRSGRFLCSIAPACTQGTVDNPLVACLWVEFQVQGYFIRTEFSFQCLDRLVVLHNFCRFYGFGTEVVVDLAVASTRHVHTLHKIVVDGFTFIFHLPVVVNIHTGELFQNILDVYVLGRGKLCQIIPYGIFPAMNAAGTYLDFFQCNGFGMQTNMECSCCRYVAYFPSIAQQ